MPDASPRGGESRREPQSLDSGQEDEPRPLDEPATYHLHERIRREDRIRLILVIAAWTTLGLSLVGLYTLILLDRPSEQITLWREGVGWISTITAAVTGYFIGGRK